MTAQYLMVVFDYHHSTSQLYTGISSDAYHRVAADAKVDHYAAKTLDAKNPNEAFSILAQSAQHIFTDLADFPSIQAAVADPCSFVMSGLIGPQQEFHVHKVSA